MNPRDAGWFNTLSGSGLVLNPGGAASAATLSLDGSLSPPQTCTGLATCPTPNYVGSGWSQWDATLSSGGECGLAYKICPIANTDQALIRPHL